MRGVLGIIFFCFIFSCTRDRDTLLSSLVDSQKVKTQFYGTLSDSSKLIIWYLEVTNRNKEVTEDNYEPWTFNLYGDEYYGPPIQLQNKCMIDSVILGPGEYTFSFDIGHPCVSDSIYSYYERRFLVQKYPVDSMNYFIQENDYNYDYGMTLSGFDSLGCEKNF